MQSRKEILAYAHFKLGWLIDKKKNNELCTQLHIN